MVHPWPWQVGYIIGITLVPASTDPQFSKWKAKDAFIVSWLFQSMQPAISNSYLFLRSSKEIWDALEKTYSEVG